MLTHQSIDPNARKHPLWLRPLLAVWHWMVPPSQAHVDRESHTAQKARMAIVVTFSLLIIFSALFWGRDLRDVYQDWRAERLVVQARELADEGNVLNAVIKAQQAYGMAPTNVNAIRLNGEFLTLMRRQEAIYFLELLEKNGAATPTDVQTKVRALLNLNRTKEASHTLEDLMSSSAPTDTMLKLAEDVWGVRERGDFVVKFLKSYVEKNPEDGASQLRLAKYQVGSNNPQQVDEGMEVLWKLAEREDDLGLSAIETLDQIPAISQEDANKLIQRLQSHPKSTAWHQVAALKRKAKIYPSQRTRIFQEAILKYRDATREDLLPLVRWLVEEREFQRVLMVLDESTARTYQPLLENYLTTLTMLNRMDDLQRLVNDPRITQILNQSILSFYQAHLAFVTGKPKEEVRRLLASATNSAEREQRGDILMAIGKYAEDRAHNEVAEEAYLRASRQRRSERDGTTGLLRCLRRNGNLDMLLASSREAARRWPDDQNYQEQFLYSHLLAGKEIELALERNLKLLELQPEDSQRKLTAALAYWRLMDLDMAVNHMQKIDLNYVTVGQRAVFAAMALDGGFVKEAKSVVAGISSSEVMLPPEKECYNRVIQHGGVGASLTP